MVASKCYLNHFISEKYKTLHPFKVHFLQNSSQVDCTLLPATVKGLETVLEAILWKPLQLFCHILNDVNSITKELSLKFWFQQRKQAKVNWTRSGEYVGCSKILILFFAKKSLTETDRCAGALSWRTNRLLVRHFSEHFLLTTSLRCRRMSMCISLFTIVISVNYICEFL